MLGWMRGVLWVMQDWIPDLGGGQALGAISCIALLADMVLRGMSVGPALGLCGFGFAGGLCSWRVREGRFAAFAAFPVLLVVLSGVR